VVFENTAPIAGPRRARLTATTTATRTRINAYLPCREAAWSCVCVSLPRLPVPVPITRRARRGIASCRRERVASPCIPTSRPAPGRCARAGYRSCSRARRLAGARRCTGRPGWRPGSRMASNGSTRKAPRLVGGLHPTVEILRQGPAGAGPLLPFGSRSDEVGEWDSTIGQHAECHRPRRRCGTRPGSGSPCCAQPAERFPPEVRPSLHDHPWYTPLFGSP